jgi:phage major head subunit gpT-like protein
VKVLGKNKLQYREKPKEQNQIRTLKADFVRAAGENANQFELSFSSEVIVGRWYGNEILSHAEGSVDLSRLATVGTVLFNHGRDVRVGKMPIARIVKTWLDSTQKKCRALIEFDFDEDSQLIKSKVESGSLPGVSFGYSVDSWEEVSSGKMDSSGRFMGPASIALRWSPYEISIEPIPADPTVGVGRENEIIKNNEEDEEMHRKFTPNYAPDNGNGGGATVAATGIVTGERAVAPVNTEELRQLAIKEERTRVEEITSICRDFSFESSDYISKGTSVEDVRSAVLEKLKAKNKPIDNGRNADVTIISEEADKVRDAVSDALLMRAGVKVEKAAEGARDFRGMRLRDIAIDCLNRDGVANAHRLDDNEILKRAISPDSQFASILSNAVNKSMAIAYKGASTTYQTWTGKGSTSDFKGATVYQISEAGELSEMTQSGEFKFDEMQDRGITKSIATFGKTFGLTRKAIIDDDLGIITKIPQAYVRAASRGINALVYKKLGTTTTQFAGANLFSSGNKNLGTQGAISTTTIGELKKLMRTQKNLRGKETLNIQPNFMIVPAALETKAMQFLMSDGDAALSNAAIMNVFKNSMNLVVDAELDQYSEVSYYVAANPADIDTIEVTYLNGDDMPKLESQMGFDFLGMQWRIYIDYGVNILDAKGMAKNVGQ